MQIKQILASTLSLALVACNLAAPLQQEVKQPPVALANLSLRQKDVPKLNGQSLTLGSKNLKDINHTAVVTQANGKEQVRFSLGKPEQFKTQLANPAELAFIRLELVGEGISGTLTHDGAEFLPVSSELTATISDIPLDDGAIRVVRVTGYDSEQNPLGSFMASGTYRSATGTTTINITLNRVQLLLGWILSELLVSNPELLPDLDLAALQAVLEEATGYNADTGEFVTDPSLFDPVELAALVVSNSPDLPTSGEIGSADKLSSESLSFSVSLPSGSVYYLDEPIRLVINDPNSRPILLSPGFEHGGEVSIEGLIPGDWILRGYDSEGIELLSVAVTVTESGASIANDSLSLIDVLEYHNEFQVNTYATGNQQNSVIGMDADGDFVLSWHSDGQDGSSYGIYARRYASSGAVLGSEFRVNTYTTSNQKNPAIGMAADGGFVISWDGAGATDSSGIYAQRYDSSGVAQGSEFKVNTYTTSNQANPAIGMDADGDFVVSWDSYGQDGSQSGVYARRYDSSGVAQGSEFKVNTYTTSNQGNPAIGMAADGDFVISWQSNNQDGSQNGVYAQRYDSVGVMQGSEFQVNTYTTQQQLNPAIGMDSDGDFVISWQSNYNQDGSDRGIFAQRYDSLGVMQGSEFQVNTYTTFDQENPSIGMDADGDFVISWQSSYNQDGNYGGIYAQRYASSGVAQDSEFLVNAYTTDHQKIPAIDMDSAGDFVITWTSFGPESDYGINAVRYDSSGKVQKAP